MKYYLLVLFIICNIISIVQSASSIIYDNNQTVYISETSDRLTEISDSLAKLQYTVDNAHLYAEAKKRYYSTGVLSTTAMALSNAASVANGLTNINYIGPNNTCVLHPTQKLCILSTRRTTVIPEPFIPDDDNSAISYKYYSISIYILIIFVICLF